MADMKETIRRFMCRMEGANENNPTCYAGYAEELANIVRDMEAEEIKRLSSDIEFVKRWVQRVHDGETTLEEFYSVLRYYEPLKPTEIIVDDK